MSDRLCAIFFPSTDVEVAAATEDGLGCCGNVLAIVSFIVIIMFFPFSLLVSIKVIFARGKRRCAHQTWLTIVCTRTHAHTDRERVRESCDPSSRSFDIWEGQGTWALLHPTLPG